MSDPRNPNYRGLKCMGCGEYLPTLLDDLCSYCMHERDKNEITRLRALNKKLTAANETMLLMGAKSQDEIERLKADPGLYATGDRSILEQNQEYKKEIERLQANADKAYARCDAAGMEVLKIHKRVAELEGEYKRGFIAGHECAYHSVDKCLEKALGERE